MYNLTQKILASLLLIAMSATAIADDIDIISQSVPIKTNVLFVMDLSGSMGELTASGATRLSELQGAFQDIVNDTDFEDINIGLSVFSGDAQSGRGAGRAHGITYPVAPVIGANPQDVLDRNTAFTHKGISFMPAVGATTNTREYLSLLSSDPAIWDAGGSTPLVDALYEAALYFKGGDVHWGRRTADHISAAHPSTYTGTLANVTATPACVSNPNDSGYNRVSCSRGSCGVTEDCGMVTRRQSSPIDTGNNCTSVPERCRAPSLGGTCGLGTNCSDSLSGLIHTCEASHLNDTACMAAHSGWADCQTVPTTTTTTDSEGNSVTTVTGSVIKCKEMRTYCDDVDTYSCDVQVEECTRCPVPSDQVAGIATYITPITEKCPANGIVLLSDGEPTANTSARFIPSLITTPLNNYANGCNAGLDDGRCGPELVSYLASEDQNTSVDGDQPVRTFTVGLALPPGSPESAYMEELALAGNGGFVNANNRAELAVAFKQAILAIAKRERTFSAPTYTVNTSTQLTHGDYVYVPMFDRGIGVAWPGNLKKYKLQNGKLYGMKNSALVEATDNQGLLKADVQDLWLGLQQGGPITSGGAAHKIPTPASRKIYTDAGVSGSNVLLGTSHELKVSNSAITGAILGTPAALERHRYIKYIRGEKADGTPRHHMGDIIHSKPLQLSYSSTESMLFVGTNEGYLHAIDANTGIELFAFMPSELLKNIKLQYENNPSVNHVYGVDGPMKLWLDDTNKNGVKDSGENAYIYFGLRRGGGSYYALKLNNTMTGAPTLAWKIDSSSDPKFSELGFTWSEPTFAKLRYEKNGTDTGVPEPVLVFGGGYVDDHNGESTNGIKASEVFIIDAMTGDHIWDSGMTVASPSVGYAVPAKVRTVDVDRNGSMDRLYFGDTGGNLWRADLGGTGVDRYDLSKSKLIHLAQLGDGSGTNGVNDRKFFTEPDVAFLKENGKYAITIAMGSGSRPDVLNTTVENYFFVVRDKDVFRRPATTPAVITLADLEIAGSSINIVSANKKGWKMPLNVSSTGEKVLSSALTFQNKVLFTSLVINEVTVNNYDNNVCSLNNNTQGRLYALDLLTGDAVLDLDSSTTSNTDSYVTVVGGEILETPQIIYGDFVDENGGDCTAATTHECARTYSIQVGKAPSNLNNTTHTTKPIPAGKTLPRVYWLDKEQ